MAFSIAGKVAAITGGTSGIGAAAVKLFLQRGAKVACLDIRAGNQPANNRLDLKCDVSSQAEVEAAIGKAKANFGRLDILVNAAGIMDAHSMSIDYSPVLSLTNLRGCW